MKESFHEEFQHIACCAFLYPRDKKLAEAANFYAAIIHCVDGH